MWLFALIEISIVEPFTAVAVKSLLNCQTGSVASAQGRPPQSAFQHTMDVGALGALMAMFGEADEGTTSGEVATSGSSGVGRPPDPRDSSNLVGLLNQFVQDTIRFFHPFRLSTEEPHAISTRCYSSCMKHLSFAMAFSNSLHEISASLVT